MHEMSQVIMTDDQLFFSSTSSSLVDTYLIYGIIGLLLFIGIIGLITLVTTSYFCFYCYFYSSSCSYHSRRHSTYKLNDRFKQENVLKNRHTKKPAYIRRYPSDITDFSQIYDSRPHLINSKATITTGMHNNQNMDLSSTTINTLISPLSPCSSFIEPVSSVQNDLGNPSQQNNINIFKTNIPRVSSAKGLCSQPFSYIKNINERPQILRRFIPHNRSLSPAVVSVDITRISSSDSDHNNQTNIYETVIPITNNIPSSLDTSIPIYETEWTHNLKKLMINKTNYVSVIDLPGSSPPDLISSSHYFQQQNPYDKLLANKIKTSDSMRRTNILQRLKDDAAFLY